jgi:serine/threonine-protein kinase HipA
MQVAEVKIWEKLAGAVAWDEESGYATFEYDPRFKTLGWDLSPLKMPLNADRNQFSFPELLKDRNSEYDTFKGLPGLLADALPIDMETSSSIFGWRSKVAHRKA